MEFQIVVELLQVVLGELLQWNITQSRNDMTIDTLLVGHLGIGPKRRFLISLIPVIQPFLYRHF